MQGWLQAGIIHSGEAAALALAKHMTSDWFLTDDAAARLVGCTMGLEVHGSLGVVLWAAATGCFNRPEADDMLEKLASSSLWISPRVVAEVRDALEQLFRT